MKKLFIIFLACLCLSSVAFANSDNIDTSIALHGSGKHCYLMSNEAESWMSDGVDVKELSLGMCSQFPIYAPVPFFSINLGFLADADLNFLVNPYNASGWSTLYDNSYTYDVIQTPSSLFGLGVRFGVGCGINVKPCSAIQLNFLPFIKVGLKGLSSETDVVITDGYDKAYLTMYQNAFLGLFEAGISPSVSVGSNNYKVYLVSNLVFRSFFGLASGYTSANKHRQYEWGGRSYCYYDFGVGMTFNW